MRSPRRTALISLLLVTGWGANGSAMDAGPDQSSREAFRDWLRGDAERRAAFAEFSAYLDLEGVGKVVPIWQLARVDGKYAARCRLGYFALPPRAQWSQIVPALKLVREKVIPVTGPVEVVSSWRSPEINRCVGGASRSSHLDFKALDLIAAERTDRRRLFADLCAMQRAAGSASRMGLGAYYNPVNPVTNPEGRFHIDANGYRTWGFDYTAKSNPCPKLG
jgi:hypothetical protein